MVRSFIAFIFASAALLLTGCATTTLPSNSLGSVDQGTVLQVNAVKLSPNSSSTWGVTGVASTLAGLVANKVSEGKSWQTRNVVTALGAALGGVGGRAAVDAMGAKGFEYVIKLASGRTVVVSQPQSEGFLPAGTDVLVVATRGIHRVVANHMTVRTTSSTSAIGQHNATYPLLPEPRSLAQARERARGTVAAASQSVTRYTPDGRPFIEVDGAVFYGARR